MRKFLTILSCVTVVSLGSFYALFHNGIIMDGFRSGDKSLSTLPKDINATGLDELNFSGSSRVAFYHLKWALRNKSGPVYLIDLTDGKIKYYNTWESSLFKDNKRKPGVIYSLRRFLIGGSPSLVPEYVETEADVATRFGLKYQVFYIPRRHIPSQETVDKIVEFSQTMPADAWLHMHCDAGRGRTTMLMIMFDIIQNAHKVPVEDIVNRQHRLGGVDLFDTKVWVNGHYTQEQLQARVDFITSFYRYVKDSQGYGKQKWSKWCDENQVNSFARFQIG